MDQKRREISGDGNVASILILSVSVSHTTGR